MVFLALYLLALLLIWQTGLAQSLGPQNCHGRDDFPGHGDVHGNVQRTGSEECQQLKGVLIVSDMDPVIWAMEVRGTYYHFSISWIDDCEGDPQNLFTPVGDYYCYDLLVKDWEECNNGGAGGWIDAGCVRYEFKPATS